MSRFLVIVLALLTGVTTTTTVGAANYTYDVSAIARVGVHEAGAIRASPAPLSVARQRSASSPAAARGTSTTPSHSVVATEAADDMVRLGTKDSWGNLNTLDDHFARHGADFGATSVDDYARQASEFLQQPGTLTKIDADGVIRVYDPSTNAFGAYNPNGTTRTFFTPKRGIDYWNDQPGVAP